MNADADGPAGLGAVVDLDAWDAAAAMRRAAYGDAEPFPHTVIDDALRADAFAAAANAFPTPGGPEWTRYFHINERKYGNGRPETWAAPLQDLLAALCTPAWLRRLEALTGISGLVADPDLDGAGLHVTPPGGHLNVHADFTAHHGHPDWQRRVNVLIYFNDRWRPGDGGALELWSPDVARCVRSIDPIGNRMVIFSTSACSYHGHPTPLGPTAPARRSLALYYFTEGSAAPARSTAYRPLPGAGLRGWAIRADNVALRAYDRFKRKAGLSDEAMSRVLGWPGRVRRPR